jgi:rubrerythrin|tara:strand:+ start:522 stop:743 length:222 start_codon:yes stop_codon:yes gene_type:complete
MWKSNKVADLLNKKQKIEKEIREIQKNCKHPKKSLKSIRERVDSSSTVIRWVCDECFLSIGYPSEKEINEFLK